MAYVIAQLSDLHIGGPTAASGEQFSAAVDEINAMTRQPDLVLMTGDLTHNGTDVEWSEFLDRAEALKADWHAIAGNHDSGITDIAGHKAVDAGPLRLVLLDTSSNAFTVEDATWLESELAANPDAPTVIAVHQPPFETGIWWMDCVGLKDRELLEEVVRRHTQVGLILSGHVHRPIQTNWGGCMLWSCPSTSVTVAIDLDSQHGPAETAESPTFGLHVYTGEGFVSHLVPVGDAAERYLIEENAPEFVKWARETQVDRETLFS